MAESSESDPGGQYWDYNPSKAAAMVFLVVYSILLLVHILLAYRHRTIWVWPLIAGVGLEVVGFATRWVSIHNLEDLAPVIVSQTTVIVAPAFIAAQNYMMVGRMMSYLGAEHSPINHNLITKIFVIADFVSIFSQGGGGGLLSGDDLDTIQIGYDILIGALAFQVLIFLIFVVLTIIFDVRSRRALGEQRRPVQSLFYAFYFSATMIIVRSIFRLIEFASADFTTDGPQGYVIVNEWLVYVFDAVPITLCVIALAVAHAGRYLPQTKGLRIDGTYEEPPPRRWLGCCCIRGASRSPKMDPEALRLREVGQANVSHTNGHARNDYV